MSVRWFLVAVIALFAAYVVGRAAGILLGIGPYVTEVIAMGLVIAALAWTARRKL